MGAVLQQQCVGLLTAVTSHVVKHGFCSYSSWAPECQLTQWLWCTGLAAPMHVGSFWTRDRTRVSCIGRQILIHCAIWELLLLFYVLCFGCKACGILAPQAGTEPAPPALEDKTFTTGPVFKRSPQIACFLKGRFLCLFYLLCKQ